MIVHPFRPRDVVVRVPDSLRPDEGDKTKVDMVYIVERLARAKSGMPLVVITGQKYVKGQAHNAALFRHVNVDDIIRIMFSERLRLVNQVRGLGVSSQ